jgi:hypothetical protein
MTTGDRVQLDDEEKITEAPDLFENLFTGMRTALDAVRYRRASPNRNSYTSYLPP